MVQRTFLVTGASKRNGLAISKRLAAAGHEVVRIAREAFIPTPDAVRALNCRSPGVGRNSEFDK